MPNNKNSMYTSILISHREPKHFVSNKNKCTVISYLCACVFFESFRRDLNEAKAVSCNVNLVGKHSSSAALFIMTLRLPLKFRVTSLTINSHRGRHSQVS